ncbi:MAG: hypothetical protein HC778_05845 [Chamaesiphon sp. CSU_1_12]|nr:hypothetical protein [Chamaesiphon sp. CSU_1_12]
MTQTDLSKDDTNRIVFEIEEGVYKQFQEAAFQKYKSQFLYMVQKSGEKLEVLLYREILT